LIEVTWAFCILLNLLVSQLLLHLMKPDTENKLVQSVIAATCICSSELIQFINVLVIIIIMMTMTLKAAFFSSSVWSQSSASMLFYWMILFLSTNETDSHFNVFSLDFYHSASLLPRANNNNNSNIESVWKVLKWLHVTFRF